MRRFPYGLIYRIQSDRVVIVAVMHLKRRPFYWRSQPRSVSEMRVYPAAYSSAGDSEAGSSTAAGSALSRMMRRTSKKLT